MGSETSSQSPKALRASPKAKQSLYSPTAKKTSYEAKQGRPIPGEKSPVKNKPKKTYADDSDSDSDNSLDEISSNDLGKHSASLNLNDL